MNWLREEKFPMRRMENRLVSDRDSKKRIPLDLVGFPVGSESDITRRKFFGSGRRAGWFRCGESEKKKRMLELRENYNKKVDVT